MPSVEFHPAARAEVKTAVEWYRERSVGAAAEFVGELQHALARISEAPFRYPSTKTGARRFVLLKFPFDVVYRLTNERIHVIAVAHHARRPGYWQRR